MIRFNNLIRHRLSASRQKFLAASKPHLDLAVIDLTSSAHKYVGNLDKAIAAVNFQVESHFQPEWGVSGFLTNKTAEFQLHLTRFQKRLITGGSFQFVTDQLVSWIVNGGHGIDWTKTGIVYVSDPNTDFGGVHLDKKVASMDIPYALVGVPDQNWSVILSHEVLELLADPWGTNFVTHFSTDPITYVDGSGKKVSEVIAQQDWIVEVCDSVEADADGYSINGIPVSNFNSKAYFNTSQTSNLDYRNLLRRTDPAKYPFPIRKGGYLSFWSHTNPDEVFQIKWFDEKEATYYKLSASNESQRAKLFEGHGNRPHHRLLKYWRARKAEHHDEEPRSRL
jgi:hypothetical protein